MYFLQVHGHFNRGPVIFFLSCPAWRYYWRWTMAPLQDFFGFEIKLPSVPTDLRVTLYSMWCMWVWGCISLLPTISGRRQEERIACIQDTCSCSREEARQDQIQEDTFEAYDCQGRGKLEWLRSTSLGDEPTVHGSCFERPPAKKQKGEM